MHLLKRKYVFAAIYSLLLVSFTVYAALDTFVTSRIYTVVPENTSSTDDTNPGENSTQTDMSVTTQNSYSDENISIKISKYSEFDTAIYVADVYVSSAEYLKTAFAQNSYGKNITEKTSETAASNNAILAVNGDYYGAQTNGYVLKNGELYRESASGDKDDLVIWADGTFGIVNEYSVSASQLLAEGAEQLLSFGPALVVDGSVAVTEDEEVGKAKASNPRTAIGIVDDLHYMLVVSDGRTNESNGLSLYQLASFMKDLGVQTAYNLDGGGSSAMYFNGEIVNNPTTDGKTIKERKVSDIVYIGY
ncbi:hypothetical protein SDC9_87681 [bioreactor metagenome]|uniref:Phosphodiester glycosidase domain-containing protein n=1 Tax=bioreactor metagenome TaxID=1076179 RepID=A0A644ZJI5_9ZZZZ|nr:phosphodiester glycosidase family protein [Candidatus Metalachnospira sp.]